MGTTETCSKTETKLKRIAWLSSQNADKQFYCLMHYFNEEALKECYQELEGNKALGIDGISKEDYGKDLDKNLKELVKRLKQMSYRPQAVREVLIPKEGKQRTYRPLGVSAFEDKLIQKMMQKVLESIYEPLFLECSYGFRPGRGCHDAIGALQNYLYNNHVRIVIDIDIENFFGTIDRSQLEEILIRKIQDKNLIRYIKRMFRAGILRKGECSISEEGVVQGSIVSPVLSNIFAHYVLDQWFEETVKRHCRGAVKLFRYADDGVICCQYKEDAERIRRALGNRLAKYNLKLNETKTKLVNYSKWEYQRGKSQGSFDFLGFTFYWGRAISGAMVPKLKTIGRRINAKLKRVNQWAREVKDKYRLREIWEIFCSKLGGHIRYYGVSHNSRRVHIFARRAIGILFKWLNRRSQRKSFTWEKFWLFVKANPLPKIKTYHKLFQV